MNGHGQAGQGHDHRAGSNVFFNKSKSGRRLNEGEGRLYDDILRPLKLLGLSSVKLGFHPEHFVLEMRILKVTSEAGSPLPMGCTRNAL